MRKRQLRDSLVILGALLAAGCLGDPRHGCTWLNPLDPQAELSVPLLAGNYLLVDDFDDGGEPDLVGGCIPLFFSDAPVTIDVSYQDTLRQVLRGHGRALRIGFDMGTDQEAFGGVVVRLTRDAGCPLPDNPNTGVPLDLTSRPHDSLTFWFKSDPDNVDFEVALRDVPEVHQTTPKVLVRRWSTPPVAVNERCEGAYRRVAIPVAKLLPAENGETVNLDRLKEINFGFAHRLFQSGNLPLKGVVYLDEIAFTGGSP